MARERQVELHSRRMRKMKLRKLRVRYGAAKSSTEKEAVIQKASRIAPWLKQEEFLAPLKKK